MDELVLAAKAPWKARLSVELSPRRRAPVLLKLTSPWKVVRALSNCRP